MVILRKRSCLTAIVIVLTGLAACTSRTDLTQPIPPKDLTRTLSDTTLVISRSDGWPYQTLLFLDQNGTGWYDGKLIDSAAPDIADLASIISWRVTRASRLCLWLSPLLGQLSSFVAPHQECLEIERVPPSPGGLQATITRGADRITTLIDKRPGDAFPDPLIGHYQERLRVFYGGDNPHWIIP